MPVIERESEESWNQWVSSLERFMDGVEGFLYGVYRVVRWPFAGLWGLGRGLLQLANILGEPEVAPAPPKHLVVDFRGAWYTGTSLMNRFGPTRRLYQWFRSWYCMGEGRLKRWYGEDYRFEEVTFQGRLHGNTAFYLFDRLENLEAHRLPGYHIPVSERPELPAREALCRVHFKGDYDLASAQGLALVLQHRWRQRYPITVEPFDSELAPQRSRWYAIPLHKRVLMLKFFQAVSMTGVLLNEQSWFLNRFKMDGERGDELNAEDTRGLHGILPWVDFYFGEFVKDIGFIEGAVRETRGLLHIGDPTGKSSVQPHTTSFKYWVGCEDQLQKSLSAQVKTQLRFLLNLVQADGDMARSQLWERLYTEMEELVTPRPDDGDISTLDAGAQALLSEFQAAQRQRDVLKADGAGAIAREEARGEFVRKNAGFWGFWQDVFGLARLKPRVGQLQRENFDIKTGEVVDGTAVAKKRSAWGWVVLGVEKTLDILDIHVYAVYSALRWPLSLAGRGLHACLQRINLLAETETSLHKHLTVDFRGRWYTGTSLLNRFEVLRRFHFWFTSWYYLSEHRLARWYGSGYQLSEVTLLGVLNGSNLEVILERLILLSPHRLPGYHVPRAERPHFPSQSELCQIHFEGDYSVEDAKKFSDFFEALSLRTDWYFPFDIKLNERGKAAEHRLWNLGGKEQRVEQLKSLKRYALQTYMSNEWDWIERFLEFPDLWHEVNIEVLAENIRILEIYLWDFRNVVCQYALHTEPSQLRLVESVTAGDYWNFETNLRFWKEALVGKDAKLVDDGPEENIIEAIEHIIKRSEGDGGKELLLAVKQAVLGRKAVEQYWDERIRREECSFEYERTDTGFCGFWQDVFGLVRLEHIDPDSMSSGDIQEDIEAHGSSSRQKEAPVVPIGAPLGDSSVFGRFQSTASKVGRDTGTFPVTLPV